MRAFRLCGHWYERSLGLVYPPACAGCGAEFTEHVPPSMVCAACRDAWRFGYALACEHCAMPLGAVGHSCRECHRRKHRFLSATAIGKYEGSLRNLVLRAKLGTDEALALALGETLGAKVAATGGAGAFDAILPIPMPGWRRLFRAGNVTEVLAEGASRRLQVMRLAGALRFARHIRKQANLKPAQRRRNVRHAMTVTTTHDLRDRRLLVIDDVLTTGATADEAARALLAAGAASVSVAVVARGVGLD